MRNIVLAIRWMQPGHLVFLSGEHNLEKEEFAACITEEMVRKMAEEYDFNGIFFTVRENLGVSFNKLSGRAYWQGGLHKTETIGLQVVDRVGSGDAFAAGILRLRRRKRSK